jgi:hypothetical protein
LIFSEKMSIGAIAGDREIKREHFKEVFFRS